MTDTPENPPAFPKPKGIYKSSAHNPGEPDAVISCEDGMTLRDYFAAKALQGTISRADAIPKRVEYNGLTQAECYADMAYCIADAMLKARQSKMASYHGQFEEVLLASLASQ